jgi:hypothetical protein
LMAYEKHGRSLTGLGVLNFVEEALHLIEKWYHKCSNVT